MNTHKHECKQRPGDSFVAKIIYLCFQ
jgi:hypothetical protein